MNPQSGRTSLHIAVVAVFLTLFVSFTVFAGGAGIELSFYTLDLSTSLTKVPDAIAGSLTALGVADVTKIRAAVEEMIAPFERAFSPSAVPVPLIGGSIEFPLPLIVIDGLRLSGGILTDTILRNVGGMFNLTVPRPLLDMPFDIKGHSGSISISELHFSTIMVTAEVVSRIDFLIAGIELGAGVSYIEGSITPQQVEIDVPAGIAEDKIAAALDALHLDQFVWSAFVTRFSLGIEVGPPFLRLFARGHFIIPLSETTGWWEIRVGQFAGSLGVVARF